MAVLVLVVVVIVVGVTIAWRSTPSSGVESSPPTLGLWSLVSGLVAAAGVAMVGQATFGWLSGFDPSGWLRIVAFWMIPAGVIVSAILGTLSVRQNAGRKLGIIGLALAALSVVAFFAMVASVDS